MTNEIEKVVECKFERQAFTSRNGVYSPVVSISTEIVIWLREVRSLPSYCLLIESTSNNPICLTNHENRCFDNGKRIRVKENKTVIRSTAGAVFVNTRLEELILSPMK